jgi:hypothetical protein
MTDNSSNFEDKFDATLRNAMRGHSEEVPEGFVDNIVQRLRSQQFADSTSHTEENFDTSIKNALVEHAEPVPEGFADTVIRRLRRQQGQKLIAKMAWQERFVLAGCIGLFAIVAGLIFVFSGQIMEGLNTSLSSMTATVSIVVTATKDQWQIVVCMLVAMGTVIYSFASSGLFRTSRA